MKSIRSLVIAIFITSSVRAVTIDFVTVGNSGNAPDTEVMVDSTTGYGSVPYTFQMGKYEITAGQYTEFLNAVAKADPTGLYNTAMGDPSDPSFGANIQRSGSSPNYGYNVAADWANRPVNWVSFWDAVRFVNWLHNGQPTGPHGSGTTEDGAYHDVGDQALFGRTPDARFFIPTENEWYKAAFHKNDGVTGNYWNYTTASDTTPDNRLPDPGNHANFFDVIGGGHPYTIGPPYFRTEVGEFHNSASPYGTFDQGGNVWEWNETYLFSFGTSRRGVRGGSAWGGYYDLQSSYRINESTEELFTIGFRVASSIPEPSALLLSIVAFATLLAARRKPTSQDRPQP